MGFDAASFEHFFQANGIFLDVGRVAGDVGDGEELAKLAHDAVFVGEAVGADFFDDVFGRREDAFGFEFAADGKLRGGWECANRGEGKACGAHFQLESVHRFNLHFRFANVTGFSLMHRAVVC